MIRIEGSRSRSVGQSIGKLQTTSSLNRLSTAPAELRSRGITAAALSTEHFDWFWWAPVERCGSNGNATSSAEFCIQWITVPATWTRDSARRGRLYITGNSLERRVAAPSAKLYSFGETRMTLGAHYDDQRRRMRAMPAVETASTRRRQLIV